MSLALPCLRRGKVVRAASAGRVQPIGGRVFAFVGGFGARTWIMTPPAVCLPFLPWIGLCFYTYFVFGYSVAVCEAGRWINGFLYVGRSRDIFVLAIFRILLGSSPLCFWYTVAYCDTHPPLLCRWSLQTTWRILPLAKENITSGSYGGGLR